MLLNQVASLFKAHHPSQRHYQEEEEEEKEVEEGVEEEEDMQESYPARFSAALPCLDRERYSESRIGVTTGKCQAALGLDRS